MKLVKIEYTLSQIENSIVRDVRGPGDPCAEILHRRFEHRNIDLVSSCYPRAVSRKIIDSHLQNSGLGWIDHGSAVAAGICARTTDKVSVGYVRHIID